MQVVQKLLLQPQNRVWLWQWYNCSFNHGRLVNILLGTRGWTNIDPSPVNLRGIPLCRRTHYLHRSCRITHINNEKSPGISLHQINPNMSEAARNVFLESSLWFSLIFSPTASPTFFALEPSPLSKTPRQALQLDCLKMNNTQIERNRYCNASPGLLKSHSRRTQTVQMTEEKGISQEKQGTGQITPKRDFLARQAEREWPFFLENIRKCWQGQFLMWPRKNLVPVKETEWTQMTTSHVFHRARNPLREAQGIHRGNLGKGDLLRTFPRLRNVK